MIYIFPSKHLVNVLKALLCILKGFFYEEGEFGIMITRQWRIKESILAATLSQDKGQSANNASS